MQKYITYRDSIEQLKNSVPKHWNIHRAKGVFYSIDVRSEDGSERLLSVSEHKGVVPRNEMKITMFMAESYEGYKLCEVGDLVINSLWAWGRGIGVSEYHGIVSTAYGVFRPKNINQFNPTFLNYLLRTKDYVGLYFMRSKGIWISRLILQDKNFLDLPIICPPKEEQDEIVQHIKAQEEKINQFIQKKQRFIELLKEQRQSIISEFLTKGINENEKRKYSGIDWIGDIPSSWEIKRLRFLGQCQNGINIGAEFFGSGFPFVSYGDIYNNEMLPANVEGLVNSTDDDRQNYSVIEGDIFFTRTSETVEEIAISSVCNQTIQDATFSGFLIRFRPYENILYSGYSKYYFRCQLHRSFFVKEMNLITRASLNQNLLKNLPVILPPIEEQKQIVSHIKTETATIDTAIAKAEREIELIKEYKEAMISEAVMGKRNLN